jgi:hypothetical protein
MKKLLVLLLPALMPAFAGAAILPDTIGAWIKGAPVAAAVPDRKLWAEYGLQDSEAAPYAANGQKYTISAYRFNDAAGVLGAFYQVRPPDAKPLEVTGIGASNGSDEIVGVGNYLFFFKGYKPKPEELNHVVGEAPKYAQSPLPGLPAHLPAGFQANTERYITGPESLNRFAASVSPSTAAFHFNAEAVVARYGQQGKETTLVVFNYPTPEMARDRIPHFQQIAGAVVKRSGPLVALTLSGSNPDDAERLLSQVKFQADVTLPEHVPTQKDNPVNLFLSIFYLCLILAGFCVLSGLVVGGIRILFRRAGASGEGDAMISLHLSGRQ